MTGAERGATTPIAGSAVCAERLFTRCQLLPAADLVLCISRLVRPWRFEAASGSLNSYQAGCVLGFRHSVSCQLRSAVAGLSQHSFEGFGVLYLPRQFLLCFAVLCCGAQCPTCARMSCT
mmetsp:Transcript_81998/g.219399  ORF Transcript_81998/g.219399 Transcript_81998/m.219399 type:complete len:120 (+) Transcript_81998:1516-1875(+)